MSSKLNKSNAAVFCVGCCVNQLVASPVVKDFCCCAPLCLAFQNRHVKTDYPAAACEQEAGAPGAGWAAKQSTSWLVLMRASWASTSSRCTISGELSESASLATRGASSAGTMGPTCITHHPLVTPLAQEIGTGIEIGSGLHHYAHICMGA